MPKQVQLRRGTTAQTAVFTGAQGEITVDTDKKTAVVHDGSTVGGFALLREVDGLKKANNLSDISGSANRIAARQNLDVLWADEVRGVAGSRSPRGGLMLDGTGAYTLNGTAGVNIGTGDFTLSVVLRLADYTPAAVHTIWMSHTAGNNRVGLRLETSGNFGLSFIDGAGNTTTYQLTPDVPLVDGETYAVTITADRDGDATLYINGISDRDKSGGGVTTSIAAAGAINVGSGNAAVWGAGQSVTGVVYAIRVFNRLMTAAEALTMADVGRTDYSDEWGRFTAIYTSDFSVGADTWSSLVDVTPTGNSDGVTDGTTSKNDCLKLTTGTGTGGHIARRDTLQAWKRYRISLSYYIPAGQAFNRIRIGAATASDPSQGNTFDGTVVGTWATVTGEFLGKSQGVAVYISLMNGTSGSFNGVAGEACYIKDLTVTPVGAVLDLDLDAADPAISLAVRDRTVNANHATATAGMVAQVQRTTQMNADRLAVGSATVLTKLLSATAALDFGSIAAAGSADLTITVNGATVGDSVALGLPSAPTSGIVYQAFVSAANTVTVRASNVTAGAIDPASMTFRVTVMQF